MFTCIWARGRENIKGKVSDFFKSISVIELGRKKSCKTRFTFTGNEFGFYTQTHTHTDKTHACLEKKKKSASGKNEALPARDFIQSEDFD